MQNSHHLYHHQKVKLKVMNWLMSVHPFNQIISKFSVVRFLHMFSQYSHCLGGGVAELVSVLVICTYGLRYKIAAAAKFFCFFCCFEM
jgi:hypothetical protein